MLNRAWEEIAENKKQLVISTERAEASVLAAKEAASLHYEALLRKAREDASAQEATLSMTIHQLRSSIARDSERAQWREEEFKKEIQVGFPPLLGVFILARLMYTLLSSFSTPHRPCSRDCKPQRQEMRSWRLQFLIPPDPSFVRLNISRLCWPPSRGLGKTLNIGTPLSLSSPPGLHPPTASLFHLTNFVQPYEPAEGARGTSQHIAR